MLGTGIVRITQKFKSYLSYFLKSVYLIPYHSKSFIKIREILDNTFFLEIIRWILKLNQSFFSYFLIDFKNYFYIKLLKTKILTI